MGAGGYGRRRSTWWAAGLLLTAVLASPPARADAEPSVGYLFGSFSLPYRASLQASRPELSAGDWTTSKHLGARESPLSLEAVGFGAGIGYDGWNAQLDVRSLGAVRSGALTFGYRLNIQLGNFELWARFAAGPSLTIDYATLSASKDVAGGIQGVAEAGIDFFVVKEILALGLKGAGVPSYTWPATFATDLDLHVGLRVLL